MIVDELVAVLGYEVKGQDKLRAFTDSIDNAARRIATFAVAAGTIAAGAAAALGKSVINVSAQFESLNVRLEALEGSAEKGRKALEWVEDFAQKTPLSLSETANAYAKLRTFGIDPTNGSLMAAVDTMAMAGESAAYLDGIVLAMGQAWTKQKLQGEEALQLIERGVPVWDLLSESMGVSVEKVQELSQKGKLGRKEMQLLFDAMGKRGAGASEKMSKTWDGLMGRLGDRWENFLKKIGENHFFDAAERQLERLMDYLDQLSGDGTLGRWAASLGNAFTWATDAVANLAIRVGRNLGTIGDLISKNKDAWEWLKWVLGGLAVRLFPVWSLLAGIAFAIEDWLTYMRGGKSVIGDFIDALAEFLGADPDAVADALGKIALAAGGLAAAASAMGLFTSSIWPLAAALGAFSAAFYLAKSGFDYLASLDAKASAAKAVDNPRAKPGYIEGGHGYDKDGKFIYMDGNRRVDRPAENPTAGFTNEALDYKFLLQNLEENRAKMEGGASAAAVTNTLTDNSDKSTTVNVGGVVVNGVPNVSAAVGSAVGSAVGGAAAGAARASRFEKDDAF